MPQRKWDRDLILQKLRALFRAGVDLSYNAMCQWNQALVSASAYHFKSYRRAVEMAGIDYTKVRKKPHWNHENVTALIRRAHRAGEDLSWRAISSRRDELGHAAMAAVHPQLFGSWEAALEAARIRPDRVRRYRRWDEAAIIETLQRRQNKGLGVNSAIIQQEIPGLYGGAVRRFGSFQAALEAAGLEPGEINQRRDWTKAEVVRQLRDFHVTHGSLSNTALREKDSGLLRAVRLHFGTLPDARRAALRGREEVDRTLFGDLRRAPAATRRRRRNADAHPGAINAKPSRNGHVRRKSRDDDHPRLFAGA